MPALCKLANNLQKPVTSSKMIGLQACCAAKSPSQAQYRPRLALSWTPSDAPPPPPQGGPGIENKQAQQSGIELVTSWGCQRIERWPKCTPAVRHYSKVQQDCTQPQTSQLMATS